jgi:hypothetical protein
MLSCREVAELLSKDEFRGAPLLTRLAVKDLAICGHCTRFARQLTQLRAAVRKSFSQQEPDSEFESRMIQKLQA